MKAEVLVDNHQHLKITATNNYSNSRNVTVSSLTANNLPEKKRRFVAESKLFKEGGAR